MYKSTAINAVRRGTLSITVDQLNKQALVSDEYDFSGDYVDAENLIFSVTYTDDNTDGTKETVNVNYINLTPGDNGLTSSFTFWYEVQS